MPRITPPRVDVNLLAGLLSLEITAIRAARINSNEIDFLLAALENDKADDHAYIWAPVRCKAVTIPRQISFTALNRVGSFTGSIPSRIDCRRFVCYS